MINYLCRYFTEVIFLRRKDREINRKEALEIADKCEYAVLSVITPENEPYAVALSVVREGENIYFHSAMEGRKIDCFKANSKGCLFCVGDTERQKDKFTTKFESAVIFGELSEVANEDEKIHALEILCLRHTPENMGNFEKAVAASLKRTAVWKLSVDEITGKRKA